MAADSNHILEDIEYSSLMKKKIRITPFMSD